MTLSSQGEQADAHANLQASYQAELAEQVVDFRTYGFSVLHHAYPGMRLDQWTVEQRGSGWSVLKGHEAAQRREDRTFAMTDFGDHGLMVREHAFYDEIETVRTMLLRNQEPLFFMAREHVGRIAYLHGHRPLDEKDLRGIKAEGRPLNLAVTELFRPDLESLHNSIEFRKGLRKTVHDALHSIDPSSSPRDE